MPVFGFMGTAECLTLCGRPDELSFPRKTRKKKKKKKKKEGKRRKKEAELFYASGPSKLPTLYYQAVALPRLCFFITLEREGESIR